MSWKMKQNLRKGFTLVEIVVVMTVVCILAGIGSSTLLGHNDEARCTEIYSILPQIIQSEELFFLEYNRYYAADQENLRNHCVDVSGVEHFSYSTLLNDDSSYSVRAEATGWGQGGWALYSRKDDQWDCDGVVIKRRWLPASEKDEKSNQEVAKQPPGQKDKKQPPGQEKK